MRHYADQGMTTIRHHADQGMTTIRHHADRGVTTMRHYAEIAVTIICYYLWHIQMIIRKYANGDTMTIHHCYKIESKCMCYSKRLEEWINYDLTAPISKREGTNYKMIEQKI